MVSTKLNIGKIPISKGEYQEGIAYQRLNQVTMLGSTYQSKIDDNTSAPAQMGADGAVENINTEKWLCIAVGNISSAKKVVYNNETSGLEAGNVQEAIDEVGSKVSDLSETLNNNSKGILWLGTSIPEGKALEKSYPMIVGERLDVDIINKSLGSSFMSTGCYSFNNPMSNLKNNNLDVGKCLSETISEKEERFRPKVTDNTITEDDLNTIKSYSFENLLLPYLNSVDTVVIDHGYNDRYVIQNQLQNEGFDEIDWNSRDKSTFVGAMNYLIDKIHEKYPRIRIILSGHYQNVNECRYVCLMQKALAEHFGYPILDLWSYAGMSPKVYVKGTGNYFTEYNKTYGTKYSPVKGSDGNYSELIINCPDTVHPHSDVSGKTINKIGVILSKLIGGQINV